MLKHLLKTVQTLLIFVFVIQNVSALPLFARQQNIACNSCHTSVPSLNKFGLFFLDNGYKLSENDKTAWQRYTLDSTNPEYHLPLAAAIISNVTADSNTTTKKVMGIVWAAGTITPELSIFGRMGQLLQSGSSSVSEFETPGATTKNGAFGVGPKVFAQYFYKQDHKFRVGSISPISRLSNVSRNNDFRSGKGNTFSGPLQKTRIRTVTGGEYRFSKDNVTFLLAAGSPFSKGKSSKGKNGSNSEFDVGIRYQWPSIQASIYSNNIKLNTGINQDDRQSIIIPVEYVYQNWTLAPTYVYSKSTTDTNQGWVFDILYQLNTNGIITSSIQTNLKTSADSYSQATTLSYRHSFSNKWHAKVGVSHTSLDLTNTFVGLNYLF